MTELTAARTRVDGPLVARERRQAEGALPRERCQAPGASARDAEAERRVEAYALPVAHAGDDGPHGRPHPAGLDAGGPLSRRLGEQSELPRRGAGRAVGV